uniref:Syndecan-4 n=1 Tax=Gasterosteus aculeatus aculeatus TaxID=481459 RepID=A0AAQ4PMG1_GASAC|nr:syndecan-4 [Gasterosteus aculeatus aculeatus]
MTPALRVCLVLLLSASVLSESVRETETWMPMKTTQTVAMSTRHHSVESSGDGSDFGFTDGEEDKYEEEDDDDDDDDNYTDPMDEEFSGSGDEDAPVRESEPSAQPEVHNKKVPEERPPVDSDPRANEIPMPTEPVDTHPSNVLMAHAGDSIFNKTEVLAALIAGGGVGLMFAVLLIVLLIYRVKKKDEGSYDLGKKPIYKKAPTTEIYA